LNGVLLSVEIDGVESNKGFLGSHDESESFDPERFLQINQSFISGEFFASVVVSKSLFPVHHVLSGFKGPDFGVCDPVENYHDYSLNSFEFTSENNRFILLLLINFVGGPPTLVCVLMVESLARISSILSLFKLIDMRKSQSFVYVMCYAKFFVFPKLIES